MRTRTLICIGIGPTKTLAKLQAMGFEGVADVRDLNPRPVRNGLTMVGERIIYELRGLDCLPLKRVPARRKGCAVTRSFSSRITERAVPEEAVAAHHAARREAAAEGLGTDHVTIILSHERARPRRADALSLDDGAAAGAFVGHAGADHGGARQGVARAGRGRGGL